MQPDLFAFGPITRGTFGEMTGAPDILRQIERVVPTFTNAKAPIQSNELHTLAGRPGTVAGRRTRAEVQEPLLLRPL
jgi:hypothetical protein